MKNKKLIVIALAVVLVIAVLLGVYSATRPETAQGSKAITVTVAHSDGTEKEFSYKTDAEYLADVLLAEGLIAGEEGPYGLTLITADGEEVVWERDNAYWQIFMDGEAAVVGVSQIPVYDGSNYSLEYTSLG